MTLIPKEDVGKGSKIKTEVLPAPEDLDRDFAGVMFDEIKKNNEQGRPTVFIVPVGPIGQYPVLARMVNERRLSLKNLVLINMDEYLDDNDRYIPLDNPLSFRAYMNRAFYDLVDEDLNVPEVNRIFPDPDDLDFIPEKIEGMGGVDIAFGGIGINGHIAFNEPPEPDEQIPNEIFKNLPTRVLTLTRETRTINSVTTCRGNIDLIPERAATVGMKEILSAKKIRFYCNRFWQCAIVRKVLHGPVTARVPASFFQEHPDAKITMAQLVTELPYPELA